MGTYPWIFDLEKMEGEEIHNLQGQHNFLENIWYDLLNNLKDRKNRIKQGPNILRWGHLPKGSFNIKEAYAILFTYEANQQFPLWKKIWNPHVWSKISAFVWLLSRKCVLT